jgi:hypothetical protein
MNEKEFASLLKDVKADRSLYVETGTGTCETLNVAMNHFDRLISVELDLDLHMSAQQSHWDDWNVRLIQGDSYYWMEHIAYSVREPAVWLLDAHFVGGHVPVAKTGTTPVLKELEFLLRSPEEHVILVDDARLFTGTGGYPTQEKVSVLARNAGYGFEIRGDVMVMGRVS